MAAVCELATQKVLAITVDTASFQQLGTLLLCNSPDESRRHTGIDH